MDGYAFEPLRLFSYDRAVRAFHEFRAAYEVVYLYVTNESGAMRRVDTDL
jgi:hypothetical protein